MTKSTILSSIVRELERQRGDDGKRFRTLVPREGDVCEVPVNGYLDLSALAAAIERDLAAGVQPCIVDAAKLDDVRDELHHSMPSGRLSVERVPAFTFKPPETTIEGVNAAMDRARRIQVNPGETLDQWFDRVNQESEMHGDWQSSYRAACHLALTLAYELARADGRPLRWTSEPPVQPGFYWLRGSRFAQSIVRVDSEFRTEMLTVWHSGNECEDYLAQTEFADAQWAGPLKPPEE